MGMAPDVEFTHIRATSSPDVKTGWYWRSRDPHMHGGPFETYEEASADYIEQGLSKPH